MGSSLQFTTFGAGCFWGTEKYFRKEFPKLKISTVGYMGGDDSRAADYKSVCTGKTGHAEVLKVEFDPNEINYRDLVWFFFRMHDPTTLNRQQGDIGTQYRSVIFTYTPEQKAIALAVKEEVDKAGKFKSPIVTEIVDAEGHTFHPAEDYHQRYLEANPTGYCSHRIYW